MDISVWITVVLVYVFVIAPAFAHKPFANYWYCVGKGLRVAVIGIIIGICCGAFVVSVNHLLR